MEAISTSVSEREYQLDSGEDGQYDSKRSREANVAESTSYKSPRIEDTLWDLLTNGIEREYITNFSFVRPEPR